jgi:hypothetical protein
VAVDDRPLPDRLRAALRGQPQSTVRDQLATLAEIYELHLAPIEELNGAEHWQHHPAVAEVKLRLERSFRQGLPEGPSVVPAQDVGAAFRALAARDPVPPVYDWLAHDAGRDDLVEFLSLEGGPDADFDDLVALCQIGLRRDAKLTLAANYWDELGRGVADGVHTELHRRMAQALGLRSVPLDELPDEALERKLLNGYLATNRALQPEMVGSLGLIECQAGPRCRRVVAALRRLGVPSDALPFYEVHARADPRHGKDWIDGAIVPLAQTHQWATRMLRGAEWRSGVNERFFTAMHRRFDSAARAA